MPDLVHVRRLAAPVVAVAATAGVAAAADAVLRAAAPAAPRLAVDAPGPLFGAHNAGALVPGRPVAACTTIANESGAAARAALYAATVTGGLARHLRLTVTRGARRGGRGTGCATFVTDPRSFAPGEAPGVVFRGALGDFPTADSDALVDPDPWPAGGAVAYRFELELADDPAAEGLSTRWDWRLAVEPLPAPEPAPSNVTDAGPGRADVGPTAPAGVAASAASSCRTVTLAGVARGRRERVLSTTVRLRAGVRAVLVVRVLGVSVQPRLVLTTGLRARDGRTLRIPRWARVRYDVNGRAAATAQVRPFRVRVAASRLRPGRNRVTVSVLPRRGRAQTATFTLRVTRGRDGGAPCVVGR